MSRYRQRPEPEPEKLEKDVQVTHKSQRLVMMSKHQNVSKVTKACMNTYHAQYILLHLTIITALVLKTGNIGVNFYHLTLIVLLNVKAAVSNLLETSY